MFIVIQQENHRDAFIEKCFGPFPTWDDANTFADNSFTSPYNDNDGYKMYRFMITEVYNPE